MKDRETRVGACADFLLGRSNKYITHKWGVSHVTVAKWLRATGHFKLRVRDRR